MEVRIIFSGLCHFAPDSDDRMHVLMPASSSHHRHVAVLEFDIAHLTKDNTDLANVMAQVPLRGLTVQFPGTGASRTLCKQIGDLRPITGKEVRPGLLTDPPTGALPAARITLPGGRNTLVEVGDACWHFNGGAPRRLAHRAVWEIPDIQTPLELQPERLSGGGSVISIPKLYPIPLPPEDGSAGPERDTVRLYVHHVPAEELPLDPPPQPPRPDVGFVPAHFAMFYSLFDQPARLESPSLASTTQCDPSDGCPKIPTAGGSPFTCMLTGSQP